MFSSGVPPTRMLYVTSASEDVITVTFATFAVAVAARPEPAWDLMIEANVDPSCSRLTRFATGVFALKKASQFAVICCSSADVEVEPEDADGLAAGADDAGVLGLGAELLLLLQAARARPAMHVSRIEEINLRVITRSFSSFLQALAMLVLTLTSARRRGRARRSAILAGPLHNPGMGAAAAV